MTKASVMRGARAVYRDLGRTATRPSAAGGCLSSSPQDGRGGRAGKGTTGDLGLGEGCGGCGGDSSSTGFSSLRHVRVSAAVSRREDPLHVDMPLSNARKSLRCMNIAFRNLMSFQSAPGIESVGARASVAPARRVDGKVKPIMADERTPVRDPGTKSAISPGNVSFCLCCTFVCILACLLFSGPDMAQGLLVVSASMLFPRIYAQQQHCKHPNEAEKIHLSKSLKQAPVSIAGFLVHYLFSFLPCSLCVLACLFHILSNASAKIVLQTCKGRNLTTVEIWIKWCLSTS